MRLRLFLAAPAALVGLSLLLAGAPGAMAATGPAAAPTAAPSFPVPPSFADLAARLLPAVVNVASTETLPSSGSSSGPSSGDQGQGEPTLPPLPPGSPLQKFFHDFMNHDQGGNTPPPPDRLQSLGSGFIIDPSGLIVTNNHVIAGAQQITVTMHDGTVLPATLVGHDERMDLALLRVRAKGPLPFVAFGDSDHIRVGDWVLAIGNPFGLGGTVTAGIVSARGRNLNEGPYDDFIQTDAPINRGNSGGPLFDMAGQVIGINTAIFSPSGGSVGIGFSIPSNIAKPVLAQLREFGYARRGWLGVRVQEVTPDIAASLGLKSAEGALVAGVNADGPADRAGIKAGDVILSFNGQKVKDMHALPLIVAETTIGATVPVTVWRHDETETLKATVAELKPETTAATTPAPNATPPETAIASLGLSLAPLSAKVRDQYHLGADQKGVVVTAVSPGGPAAARGLKPGDVVLEVQQQEVSSPADVVDRLDAVRREGRPSVLMLIQRGSVMNWVPLPLSGAGGPGKVSPG
ncbi:MAG TPA: DegQ family serine endoprotease [Acetobacteraceae bacterium]|nr:DegQ family serine endoprotease [Acetobacteraceae bacterium]